MEALQVASTHHDESTGTSLCPALIKHAISLGQAFPVIGSVTNLGGNFCEALRIKLEVGIEKRAGFC